MTVFEAGGWCSQQSWDFGPRGPHKKTALCINHHHSLLLGDGDTLPFLKFLIRNSFQEPDELQSIGSLRSQTRLKPCHHNSSQTLYCSQNTVCVICTFGFHNLVMQVGLGIHPRSQMKSWKAPRKLNSERTNTIRHCHQSGDFLGCLSLSVSLSETFSRLQPQHGFQATLQ